MLIVTEPKVVCDIINGGSSKFAEENIIFNLNANNKMGMPINIFPPQQLLPMINTDTFDSEYVSYIMTNDQVFVQFFLIPLMLYQGHNAVLVTYREPTVFDPIMEVIVKLIQQRYGYNYNLVSSYDDYISATESGFTPVGIQQFDEDFKRYTHITAMMNPEVFTKERIHDEHL